MNLNFEQLSETFERDGYCLVPHLFSSDECQSLKAEAYPLLNESGAQSTVYVGAAAASPLFGALADDARIVDILRVLMPDDVAFLSDKIVLKSGAHRFPK